MLECRLKETREALEELRETQRAGALTATGETLIAGGSLRAALLEAMLDALRGARPRPLPFLDTATYYRREQSDWSAVNTARRVWGVLDERYATPFDASVLFHPRPR